MQSVLTAMKAGTFCGFALVSGSVGKQTASQLQDFPIFSVLNSSRKMQNSNSFTDQLLTGQFLTYLLNAQKKYSRKYFSIQKWMKLLSVSQQQRSLN